MIKIKPHISGCSLLISSFIRKEGRIGDGVAALARKCGGSVLSAGSFTGKQRRTGAQCVSSFLKGVAVR